MHFSVITDAQRTFEADKHGSRANTSMDCVASQKKPFNPLGDLETVARQGNAHSVPSAFFFFIKRRAVGATRKIFLEWVSSVVGEFRSFIVL